MYEGRTEDKAKRTEECLDLVCGLLKFKVISEEKKLDDLFQEGRFRDILVDEEFMYQLRQQLGFMKYINLQTMHI